MVNRIFRKTGSWLLMLAMLLTLTIPASAADTPQDVALTAALDKAAVTTKNAGDTFTLTLKKDQAMDLCTMGFSVEFDQSAFTLEKIEGKNRINITDNDVNIDPAKGLYTCSWYTSDVEDITVAEPELAVLTFRINEGIKPGTYSLGVKDLVIAKEYATKILVNKASAYASLTVSGPADYTASFGTPSAETVSAGDSFSIPLVLTGEAVLSGAQLQLDCDPSVAKITGVEWKDTLAESGTQTIAEDGSSVLLTFYGAELEVSEGVVVADVQMEAVAPGTATLSYVSGIAADSGQTTEKAIALAEEGAAVTVTGEAVPAFRTHSLLLSGRIGVNFFMDLPEIEGVDYTDSYVEFTVNGKSQKDTFDPAARNASGYYGFTAYVNSVQMADEITAVFHYGDGQTVEETYSVAMYVETFKEHASSFDQKTQDLIAALADYGHYIQPFLAGNASSKWKIGEDHQEMAAVNELTNEDVKAAAEAVKDYAVERDAGDSGIQKVSFSLYLDSDTALYFYLKPKADFTGDVSALIGGSGENAAVKQKDGRYRVAVPGISAHLLGTEYTVEVSAGSSFTVKASALSYVNALMRAEQYQNDEDAQYAMTSLYRYYAAAAAFKS